MYTRTQLEERIIYLRSISPAGAANLFSGLISALNDYFERDEEFEKLVRKTLMRVVSDTFSRGLIVEFPELLPELSTEYPAGYEDVREIFSSEVFEEIMTIEDEIFKAAFVAESQSSGSGGQTTTYTNKYITKWIADIGTSKGSENGALEAIGEFCIMCNEERGLALIFEELGYIRQKWSKKKRELAKHCYIERGYDWIISTFELNVFEPHYLPELKAGDE